MLKSNRHKISDRTLAGIGVLAFTGAVVLGGYSAQADVPNHEVPTWMRQACTPNHPVNCYHRGSEPSDERYVRQMPGRAHMVCVIYVTKPRHDYCA